MCVFFFSYPSFCFLFLTFSSTTNIYHFWERRSWPGESLFLHCRIHWRSSALETTSSLRLVWSFSIRVTLWNERRASNKEGISSSWGRLCWSDGAASEYKLHCWCNYRCYSKLNATFTAKNTATTGPRTSISFSRVNVCIQWNNTFTKTEFASSVSTTTTYTFTSAPSRWLGVSPFCTTQKTHVPAEVTIFQQSFCIISILPVAPLCLTGFFYN